MSDQRVVYAGQEDVTVIKIVSATIGGTTHAGSVARFNQKLLPGRSYTLRIKFDELEWAGSNIFWDGNRLWFYPAGNTTNQGYQGVFFKFGSLVGISPVGPFSTGTTVYVAGETGASSGYTWDEIRYWDGNGDVGDPDTETLTGDICRYINWGYRLPKRSEFGSAGTWQPTEGWEKGSNGFVGQTTSEAAGTDNMLAVANRNYAKNVSMGGVTMPASGYRSLTGELGAVGLNGVYWTGTFFNEGDGRYLHFDTEKFAPGAAAGRGCAFSVRCVKN
jgi:hypothetical protein